MSQLTMSKVIKDLGYKVIDEYETGHKVYDMYLPEQDLLIEYNGPMHFLNGTTTFIGPDLYTKRLLNNKHKLMYFAYSDVKQFEEFNNMIYYKNDDFQKSSEGKGGVQLKDFVQQKIEAALKTK